MKKEEEEDKQIIFGIVGSKHKNSCKESKFFCRERMLM